MSRASERRKREHLASPKRTERRLAWKAGEPPLELGGAVRRRVRQPSRYPLVERLLELPWIRKLAAGRQKAAIRGHLHAWASQSRQDLLLRYPAGNAKPSSGKPKSGLMARLMGR